MSKSFKIIRATMLFAAIGFFITSLIMAAVALHDIDNSQNMGSINKASMVLLKTELWPADLAADGVTSYTQTDLYLLGIRTFIAGAVFNIFSFIFLLFIGLSDKK